MRGRRISFVSPLPPEPSGVADYSATLLPALAGEHTLRVFTRHPERSRHLLSGSLSIRGYAELDAGGGVRSPAVYQIGNHFGFHGEVYRLALARPGVSVLHEYVLHDLVRESCMATGGRRAYAEELRYALGRTGEALLRRVEVGGEGLSSFSWPLFERIVDRSLCTVVHSESARRRLQASRPRAAIVVAPHPVDERPLDTSDVLAFRDRYRIERDSLLVGAFGVVAPTKRLDLALAGFDAISPSRSCTFLVVGKGGRSWLRSRGHDGGADSRILALGRVDDRELRCAMAACDVAVNLRDPSGGETSGTCLRLLALGKPVIVSDQGWFAEIPDDCCAKIPVAAAERSVLAAVLEGLADNAELRRRMGDNARRWARARHSLDATVRAYGTALDLATAAREPELARLPPLAPFPRHDVFSELVRDVTAAAGDLGITEEDDSMLAELAKTMVALDLHRDTIRD